MAKYSLIYEDLKAKNKKERYKILITNKNDNVLYDDSLEGLLSNPEKFQSLLPYLTNKTLIDILSNTYFKKLTSPIVLSIIKDIVKV